MTVVRPAPAAPPPAGPDADAEAGTEALFPEARRRRRRRRAVGAGGLTLALVAALVLVWTLGPGAPQRTPRPRVHASAAAPASPPPSAPATMPHSMVGWTATGSVAVFSTRTGAMERTLATDVSVDAPGLPSVSVAPDGIVYFESAEAASVPAGASGGDQILSVPITGGPVRDLGPGSDPEVSPDGASLAFIAPVPSGTGGEAPYLVPPTGIDIASLSPSGAMTGVRRLPPGAAQSGLGASDLSWSPDSRALSFDLYDPTTLQTSAWTLALTPPPLSLAAAVPIPLHAPGLTWNGYFGSGPTGDPLGIGVLPSPAGNGQHVVTIDARTGAVGRTLFTLRDAVCEAVTAPRVGGCSSLFANPVVADPASSSVLVAGAVPVADGALTTSGRTDLFVWYPGLHTPERVAGSVDVASWAPAASEGAG